MRANENHNNTSGHPPATWRQSRSRSAPPLLETNVPRQVPLIGEYSGYDAFQGEAIGDSDEGACSPVPLFPGLRPDPWDGASESAGQPAVVGSRLPAIDPQYPVQPANAPKPPYTFGPAHQQYPDPVIVSGLQFEGPAVVQDASGEQYYRWQSWTSSQPLVSSPPSTGLFPQSPVPPQGLNVTNKHYLPPPILVPQLPSQYRGKRRALVIGINYTWHPNPDFQLRHGIEDAYGMANFLCGDLGFAHEDVRIMTDKSSPWDLPTKHNILGAMGTLVHGAQPHDSLFLYFSGHAQQIEDLNGDTPGGFDECICAMDYNGDDGHPTPDTPGLIVDDLMHEIMVKPLPSQCRLTAIFDACHSGTLNLPYLYDSSGVVKRFKHPHKLRTSRIMERTKLSSADVISLRTSRDRQTSLEMTKGGAIRQALIDCVRASQKNTTYKELIRNLREDMKRHGFQPLLSSSREIDTNFSFRLQDIPFPIQNIPPIITLMISAG